MRKKCMVFFLIFCMVSGFFPFARTSVVYAADPHPWFIDIADVKNRIDGNDWAQMAKSNLLSAANTWLSRNPIFETDAENHYTGRPDFTCPIDSASLVYTYSADIPTSFACPGADGVVNTGDDHTLTAADVTYDQWTSIVHGWEVKREYEQLGAVSLLALAYQLADDSDSNKPLYAQKAVQFLQDYCPKYVNYKRHDNTGSVEPAAVKSSAGKASEQWLDDAQFFIQPCAWAYDLLYDSGYLSGSDKTDIENALRSGIGILPSSSDPNADWSVPYNWGTCNSAARASVGYVLGDTAIQQSARDGFNYQMNMANGCVKSDGLWWEGTVGYHNYVLYNLFILCESAYMRGASTHDNLYGNTTLKQMYLALTKAAYPNYELQANGDSGGGGTYVNRIPGVAANMEAANNLYSDTVFDNLLNLCYTGSGALDRSDLSAGDYSLFGYKQLFIAQNISSNGGIDSSEGDFPGMATLRLSDNSTPGDEIQSTIDNGDFGGSHGHYDRLNMTAYGKGIVWGKDTGVCSYGSNLANDWFEKPIAHNTVGIRDMTQNQTGGVTRLLETSGRMHVASAEATGVYDSVAKYIRTNILVKPYIVDIFRVANASTATFIPEADSYIQDGTAYGDTNFGLKTALGVKGTTSPGYRRMAYIRMNFSNFTDSSTSSATLKIYGRNATDSNTVNLKVYGIADDNWNESTMTWNNGSPNHNATDCIVEGAGAQYLGQIAVNNTAQYYSLDVTSFVNSNISDKKVSFIIADENHSGKTFSFNSRENNAYKPLLTMVGNCNIDYDYAFHNPGSSLSISGVSLSSQSGSLGSANGYQYIDSLQKGTASGQWSAEFTNNADTSKKYKITMLPMADMEVAAGQTYGMGSSANTKQPILVAKKTVASTGNTDFVSVHEPYTTASQISSVTAEDGAVKVTKTSGDIDYIRYDVDNNKYALVTTDSSGAVQNIESVANANVAVSGTTYLITSDVPDTMSVAFNGPVLNITQSPAYLGPVSIYTGSQTVTSVVVNGVPQPFTQSGSTILYGRAVTFSPHADAYIRDGSYSSTNYGFGTVLNVKNISTPGYNRKSYLRFDFSSLAGKTVQSAKLRLYAHNGENQNSVAVKVYGIPDDTWGESTITWENAPVTTTEDAPAVVNIDNNSRYYEFDVTEIVSGQNGDKIVSFLVEEDFAAASNILINSKENATHKPELEIEPVPMTVTYNPAADAFIRDGSYSTINYGSNTSLNIKNITTPGYSRKSYLKFNFKSFSGPAVQSAKLRLYAHNGENSNNVPVKIYCISDDTWGEDTIMWINAPVTTGAASIPTVNVNDNTRYYEFDVTELVNSQMMDKIVSFVAVDESGTIANILINSKENASNKPELTLTY